MRGSVTVPSHVRGRLSAGLAISAPLGLWAGAQPLGSRFSETYVSLTSIGVALALVGMSAFAVNIVLGARISAVARFMGGVDEMYRVHRTLGRVAYVLLLLHACFIFSGQASVSWDAAWGLLAPSAGRRITAGVIALALMTAAICLTLYARLNHELFVYVQRTFGVIFLIGAFHAFAGTDVVGGSRWLDIYLVVLAVLATGAYLYRSVLPGLLIPRHDHVVIGLDRLGPNVTEITMRPKGEPLAFEPGQFVFVMFDSAAVREGFHALDHQPTGSFETVTIRTGAVRTQFHPFSITSAPGSRDLSVVVKVSGDYTDALQALEVGAGAKVEGPYGTFSYTRSSSREQIWVAGGVGITPFLSMVRSLEEGHGYDIDLFYATKSAAEAYFVDQLHRHSEKDPHLRLHPYPEDESGFLTATRVQRMLGPLKSKEVFLCGPPAMVDSLRHQFLEHGVPARLIHFEEFGFAGKKRLFRTGHGPIRLFKQAVTARGR